MRILKLVRFFYNREMKSLNRNSLEETRNGIFILLFHEIPSRYQYHLRFVFQGGYKIPKGVFVALQIYFIHRDER